MGVEITCDECGAGIFRWRIGDKTNTPAEGDVWNVHVCARCKPLHDRLDKELDDWRGKELERHKGDEELKIKELRKKYFGG